MLAVSNTCSYFSPSSDINHITAELTHACDTLLRVPLLQGFQTYSDCDIMSRKGMVITLQNWIFQDVLQMLLGSPADLCLSPKRLGAFKTPADEFLKMFDEVLVFVITALISRRSFCPLGVRITPKQTDYYLRHPEVSLCFFFWC